MKRLKIDKYGAKWDSLHIWVNPFMKSGNFFYLMWLNVRLIYGCIKTFSKQILRNVFKVKFESKPITKEEIERMVKALKEIDTLVQKINRAKTHQEIKDKWIDAGLLKEE